MLCGTECFVLLEILLTLYGCSSHNLKDVQEARGGCLVNTGRADMLAPAK